MTNKSEIWIQNSIQNFSNFIISILSNTLYTK